MKLKVLALAVTAAVAFPMAAQAEFKISGDVGVGYSKTGSADGVLGQMGTNFTLSGSQEIGGITYFGNLDLDVDGTDSFRVKGDDWRVGAKGGFGTITLGDTDNACDMFDPGPAGDYFTGGMTTSCVAADRNNISYRNKFGNAEFGISHNPNSGTEHTAVGAAFSMAGFGVNLGYETGDAVQAANAGVDFASPTAAQIAAADEGRISYGITGSFAGVSVNLEGNDQDQMGVNAAYTMGPATVWVSHAIDDGKGGDGTGAGVIYKHGQMDYILEYSDPADKTVAALRYRF